MMPDFASAVRKGLDAAETFKSAVVEINSVLARASLEISEVLIVRIRLEIEGDRLVAIRHQDARRVELGKIRYGHLGFPVACELGGMASEPKDAHGFAAVIEHALRTPSFAMTIATLVPSS
jgi:hypothetical protein